MNKAEVKAGDSRQAAFIAQVVFKQTQQSASRIIGQLHGLTGKARAVKMMELMTGQKTVIQ
ncbi:MAG: hypothetical protein Q7R70_00795 [Candidatus Diapherotrites archaeon]|nr:hypothetical protein [Candidatus Diapherotrites archaeon]